MSTVDLTPSPRLLQVLGDIPLAPWQCVAELVDNSLDELLKQEYRTSDNPLEIDISIEESEHDGMFLSVSDTGTGMSQSELERSLRAGHSGKHRYGSLGLFGMGFNIATARLGNVTTVSTTQSDSDEQLHVTIDFNDLQRRESFRVPVERTTAHSDLHGTTVRVKLKREMAEQLRRKSQRKTLMTQLGDVYSFLLRDGVPGISRGDMSSPKPVILRLNGEKIEAKLPCVWSDQRAVTSRGQQVHAIQYVDVRLTEATACLDCGYWDRKNGPEMCEECTSTNLELRERHIWGWLGIQRYIDTSHYGIDFLRYGRKILKQDKTIFIHTDPDTLQQEVEYPIEMPANRGRIVGEIHLDHVPVTYQKNDFVRTGFDWQKAEEVIRGTGPMKPKSSKESNNSYLALLYSAYRRNDPGLRYLTPGDGTKALHDKAKEWAQQFYKGVPSMMEDTKWFEYASRHQNVKDGVEDPDLNSPAEAPAKEVGSGSAVGELLGNSGATEVDDVKLDEPSRFDKLEAARHLGTKRDDLSDTFKLRGISKDYEVSVITTRDELFDDDGNSIPALSNLLKGTSIEIFVSTTHPIFSEFGRDMRDVALMESAVLIRDLSNSNRSVASIYGEMIQEIPDLKETTPAILERIERTLDRLRELLVRPVSEDPSSFWDCVDAQQKEDIEQISAAERPTESLQELVDNGDFILFAQADAIATVIEKHPVPLFDGSVFSASFVHRTEASQERMVGTIVRSLQNISTFQSDSLMRQKHDVNLVQISLELLEDQLISEEALN